MMTILSSACGASLSVVDEATFDANPNGFACCSVCDSILACRNAWMSDLDAKVGA
jgi:hypothetical protein